MLYRKRPVVIEAIQWTGENWDKVLEFIPDVGSKYWLKSGAVGGTAELNQPIIIKTLEGNMTADVGDWIICGVVGEYYPVKPDVFEKTYERVE